MLSPTHAIRMARLYFSTLMVGLLTRQPLCDTPIANTHSIVKTGNHVRNLLKFFIPHNSGKMSLIFQSVKLNFIPGCYRSLDF